MNRQYIGARYVPKMCGEHNSSLAYEGLSVVTHLGASFTSKKYVPAGVSIDDTRYWTLTGNYNAQVEAYREETLELEKLKSYVTPQKYGATGDGIHDDTAAFQSALNDNKDVYVPAGTYLLNGTLSITKNYKTIIGDSSAWLNFKNANECCVRVTGNYVTIRALNVKYEKEEAIDEIIYIGDKGVALPSVGFNCELDGCTVSGNEATDTTNGIQFSGAEGRLYNCNVRNNGGHGVIVTAHDCNIYNLYTQMNKRDGLRIENCGGHYIAHAHSYNNGRKSIYVYNSNKTIFINSYSDKCSENGLQIQESYNIEFVSSIVYKCGGTFNVFIENSNNIKFDCLTATENTNGTYSIGAHNSRVTLVNCDTDMDNALQLVNSHANVEHCIGKLSKYNLPPYHYNWNADGTIAVGETKNISVQTDIKVSDLISPCEVIFNCIAGWRYNDNSNAGVTVTTMSLGYGTFFNNVELLSANNYVAFSNANIDTTGEYVVVNFTITNNTESVIRCGGNVVYECTTRGAL